MRSVLKAIQRDRRLKLQIVVTGMHLSAMHGRTIDAIGENGWNIDAAVPWRGRDFAEATGMATAKLAKAFEKLKSDIVMVVGDRVEAFAAAAAACLGNRVLAHVHGGDRALGQVDDSLRHAITKLAHVHFPATAESAGRLAKLGEESWRIHRVGSPGIDGIRERAADRAALAKQFPELEPKRYALVVLHPMDADEGLEFKRAQAVLFGTFAAGVERAILVYPNNDPGSAGIIRAWKRAAKNPRCAVRRNLPREVFLGLLRDAAVLVGNSSAGIIEAASFGTPVVDVGPRQLGRERNLGVRNVAYDRNAIKSAVAGVWRRHRAKPGRNIYGGGNAGPRIAEILGRLKLDAKLRRKLIAY
jgi:GDP/UDP-N,N'-diacetylbacillosamine 2-epimerase (hydrolysing)